LKAKSASKKDDTKGRVVVLESVVAPYVRKGHTKVDQNLKTKRREVRKATYISELANPHSL
jgi:hypothetical protein